jgi:hypothetical protein
MKFRYVLIIFILFVLLSGCKPSIKGETSRYNRNQQNIIVLSRDFPEFKEFLVELSRKAERVFKEADSITDEDAKAEKMLEANRTIYNDTLYKNCNTYNSLVKKVEDKKRELEQIRDDEFRTVILAVINNINDHLLEAGKILRYARPRRYNDAVQELDKALALLAQAEKILDDAIDAINKEKNKATPGAAADNSSGDSPSGDMQEDLGGRQEPGSGNEDYGGRKDQVTEEEDLGGRG